MNTAEIRLYEILKAKLGEEETLALVELAEKTVDQRFDSIKSELATKNDLTELSISTKKDIADLRVETKRDIADLRAATQKDIADLAIATKKDISDLKAELIKRIYQTSAGQLLLIIGSMISLMLMLRKINGCLLHPNPVATDLQKCINYPPCSESASKTVLCDPVRVSEGFWGRFFVDFGR